MYYESGAKYLKYQIPSIDLWKYLKYPVHFWVIGTYSIKYYLYFKILTTFVQMYKYLWKFQTNVQSNQKSRRYFFWHVLVFICICVYQGTIII